MSDAESRLVEKWMREIDRGIEYKKKYADPKSWERFKKYYRGEWDNNIVPVNKTFSYVRSLIPRIYFRDPTVTVTAQHPDYEWNARVVESVANYLIRELSLKQQLKLACLDAVLCGTGVIKLGFDSEFGYLPAQTVLPDGETVTQVHRREGRRIEYSVNVKPGMPWALRVPPTDIIVPWGYSTPESLPWVCHVIVRPLDDVKGDPKYENTSDLKGSMYPDKGGYSPFVKRPEGEEFCLLYEIRDVKEKEIIVLSEGKVLLKAEDVLQIEGLPYEFIIFNPDPDHFWGIPDVRIMEPQQKELNENRTQTSLHRRAAVLKLLYSEGALEKEDLDKLLGNEPLAAIKVKSDVPLSQVVLPFQPHIPPDLWRDAHEVMADMREEVGFSRNQAGEFAGMMTPRTATEVATVREASEIRADERRDIIADTLVSIVRKWNQFVFKFWDAERVTKIVGPDGVQHWIRYTGADLVGEYALTVNPDTGMPVTRALRYRQVLEVFRALVGHPAVDQMRLLKLFLQQFEWVDPTIPLLVAPEQQQFSPEMLALAKGTQPGLQPGRGGEDASIRIPMPEM